MTERSYNVERARDREENKNWEEKRERDLRVAGRSTKTRKSVCKLLLKWMDCWSPEFTTMVQIGLEPYAPTYLVVLFCVVNFRSWLRNFREVEFVSIAKLLNCSLTTLILRVALASGWWNEKIPNLTFAIREGEMATIGPCFMSELIPRPFFLTREFCVHKGCIIVHCTDAWRYADLGNCWVHVVSATIKKIKLRQKYSFVYILRFRSFRSQVALGVFA